MLIIRMAGDDPDYCETLRKFYGRKGYYTGLIAPAILIGGAIIAYFVIMSQVLYPIMLAIYAWISGSDPNFDINPSFARFSTSYVSLALFVVLVIICNKKDINIFMRIGSFGIIFVVFLMIFIIATGVIAFTDTTFSVGSTADSDATDWGHSDGRILVMFNLNFSPLLGILCTGYFLHTCSLPIVRSSKNPDKVGRDMFFGYLFVFISYVVVGCMGYIGFMGTNFSSYFVKMEKSDTAGQIDQNCLNMFNYKDVAAFVLRLAIFLLMLTTYPLLNFFLKDIILKLFFRNIEVSDKTLFIINFGNSFFSLLFALFFPSVGIILSYAGAISGLVIIYALPVTTYMKWKRTQI